METNAKPNKIMLVLRKEWIELRQQKGLLIGMFLPPLIFAILPLVALFTVGHTGVSSSQKEMPADMFKANPLLAGMNAKELGQTLVGQQFSVLFLLLPAILPSIIASYSVVGEKTEKTLEPVLATPVQTWEFLVGKSLAAMIPSVVLTWLMGIVFVAGTYVLAISPAVVKAIISPGWIIGFVFSTPVLSLISIAATVAVSSRVNDPRTAQQISAVLILPVMMLFFAQLTGILVLSPLVAILTTLVLALIAGVMVWVMVRLFQREVILTKWT